MRETLDQIVSRNIGGLWPQFQDTLNMFSPSKVSDAHQQALLLEKQYTRRPQFQSVINAPHAPAATASSSGPRIPTPIGVVPPSSKPMCGKCFTCGETGHHTFSCPKGAASQMFLLDEAYVEEGYAGPPLFDTDPKKMRSWII
ncbi:hypothetical protein ACS0TY_020995 [Phlomoides rotata]